MKGRVLQVDLLKGAAILAVVVMHGMSGPQQMELMTAFHISQAVPVFFLLMAYNAKASFDRGSRGSSLGAIYTPSYLGRRLWRLLMPLAIAVLVATGVGLAKGVPLYVGPLTALLWMPVPLVGQFFIVVSVAFVLGAPVLYLAYRRAPAATVAACILGDVAFEVVATRVHAFADTYYLYQIMPFRFLALFGLGMWLSDGADPTSRRNRFVLWYAAASVTYLAAFQVGVRTPFLNLEHMYNVLAFGYPLLLVAAGLTWLPAASTGPASAALGAVGRASYHIFLVQAVWFSGPITLVTYGSAAWVPLSLAICCGVGWLWYRLEQRPPWGGTAARGSDGPFEEKVQVD